jgi:hypothetical protein
MVHRAGPSSPQQGCSEIGHPPSFSSSDPLQPESFALLSKGRRREYADYIAEAKRDETKEKRLEKILPMIAAGKGLHDKYRK